MRDHLNIAEATVGPTDEQLLDVLLAGLGLGDEPDSLWWDQVGSGDSIEQNGAPEEDEAACVQVPAARAVVDALGVYLKQIGSVPLLEASEEVALAKRVEAGLLADDALAEASRLPSGELRELVQISEEGLRAKNKMICSNLRLVVSIARRYQRNGLELLDLVQEGNLGLIKAVEKFDHTRGNKFSTYATWWIRQAITRALADQARTIRVPVYMVEVVNNVIRTCRLMYRRLGHDPSDAEVAAELGMTPERVREARALRRRIFSLNEPMSSGSDYREYWLDGDSRMVELQWLLVERDPIDECAVIGEEAQLRDVLHDVLDTLEAREVRVLALRFGLVGGEPMTLEEIGGVLAVSRERVRQIERKALQRLQDPARAGGMLGAWVHCDPT